MTAEQLIEPAEADWTVPRQPVALTLLKIVGVVAASVLFVTLLVRVVGALVAGTSLWGVVPALVLGYMGADLLSGSVHWFCDTFFSEETPWIGKTVIQPFRDHHDYPQRITAYRFLEQDTTTFFLMLPLLALAFWRDAPQPGSVWALFWSCALVGLSAGSFGTNLFHKWAHAPDPPRLARWLQRSGLILGPARHQRHHSDYTRGFCVTSGWLNRPLDALRFFPRLERLARFFQR